MHRRALLTALLVFAGAGQAAHAQAADPAAQVINRFDESLLSVMREGPRLGPKGRFARLEPVIAQTFDLPLMTRFAVGTTWAGLSAAQQEALTRAFSRLTVATYAHNFDSYSGERFSLLGVETRGPDKLVRTELTSAGKPTPLTYRMRQAGGAWKVIDVYYNGAVSSLLGQRSEFASTLRAGGAPALVKTLDRRADELLAGK